VQVGATAAARPVKAARSQEGGRDWASQITTAHNTGTTCGEYLEDPSDRGPDPASLARRIQRVQAG